MSKSVSPHPESTAPPPAVSLSDPFDDESGVHDISLPPSGRSEASTQPPPSVTEIRAALFNGLSSQDSAEPVTEIPAAQSPVPSLRDDPSTCRAPAAIVARLCRISEENATQPAPDSDSAAEIYKDMVQSGALRAVALPTPQPAANTPRPLANLDLALARMKDCFTDGNYEGCLETAEQILAEQPDHEGAGSYARSCQRLLEQRHVERIGDLSAIPFVGVSADQMRWLALDHREGFLLSLIDGQTSIEELCDIAGMTRVDVLKTLAGLIDAEVLHLR